jgi:MFS family permease
LNLQDIRVALRFLIDIGPLRSSTDFERLFVAQSVSMVGSQFSVVAVAYQVFSLTGSSLQVGAVSLVQLLPFVFGAVSGGAIAEAMKRRTVLSGTSLMLAASSAGMAFNAFGGRHASLMAVYLITAIAAGMTGVISTSATAIVANLVKVEQLTPAFATLQVIDQLGMVAGPALGGVLIAVAGLPLLYCIDSLTFLWAAAFFWRISEAGSKPARNTRVSRSVLDGLRYLRGRQPIQGAYLVDLCATVFGLPRAAFPALTHAVFHGGPATLGLLYAAAGAGALVGTVASGWLSRVRRQGLTVLGAVAFFGVSVMFVGLVRVLWLDLILLAVAGWADVISAVLRSTIIQTAVHDEFRARVSGLQMAVVEGGPRLGDLESGGVASEFSPQVSIVSGGIACVLGVLALALFLPGFRNFTKKVER